MEKKIYLVQPTYSMMDGKLIKEFPLFNYSYNLPILSATIPSDWQKQSCLEYTENLDLNSEASVIIITSPGYDISHAVEIVKKYKEKNKIVIFGAHMDEFSDKILRDICDSVFYGYPNPKKMKDLLDDIEQCKLKDEYHFGYNINFSFDYSILNKKTIPFIPVLASLGCKYKCSYCCYTPLYNGHYRLRNIENVITDLNRAAKFKKPVAFLDANIYNNRKYLILLCNRIIEEKISVRWGAQCTVDIGDDKEVLNLLNKAGCRMLFLGLETLDNKNLKQLRKPMNVDFYSHQVSNIHRAGIYVGAFFMLGLDEDDLSSFDKVYSFFQYNNIEVPYVHLYFPVPGTSLAGNLKRQGRILQEFFDNYLNKKARFSAPCSIAYFTPSKLSRGELETGYLQLYGKLTSYWNILKRTIVPDPIVAQIIFKLNLEARRKYKSMLKNAALGSQLN
jgi:radical SAM superfamily enzyme YgiQ (UPF0313 family)